MKTSKNPVKAAKKKTSKRGRRKTNHSDSTSDGDKDKVVVNGVEINIENITDEELIGLRKVIPRKDYR